jgi:thymidylate kinase
VPIDENPDCSRKDVNKRVILRKIFNGIVCDELRYSSAIYQAFRRLADLDQFSRCAS